MQNRKTYRVVMKEDYSHTFVLECGGRAKFEKYIREQRCETRKTQKPICFPENEKGRTASWNTLNPHIVERIDSPEKLVVIFCVVFSSYDVLDARSVANQIASEFGKLEYRLELCIWELLDNIKIEQECTTLSTEAVR